MKDEYEKLLKEIDAIEIWWLIKLLAIYVSIIWLEQNPSTSKVQLGSKDESSAHLWTYSLKRPQCQACSHPHLSTPHPPLLLLHWISYKGKKAQHQKQTSQCEE